MEQGFDQSCARLHLVALLFKRARTQNGTAGGSDDGTGETSVRVRFIFDFGKVVTI